jgi:hypothetical protein
MRVCIRIGYLWNIEQSSAVAHSKASMLPRSAPNLSRSMRQRRLPFLQWRSDANPLRKGELSHTTTQSVEARLPTT